MKVFEDLERRGLVKQVTDREGVCQLLEAEQFQTFYLGIDPTADSLHVGHLLPIVTAKRLVDAGHRCIFVIGGATAMIGDPTGKNEMRQMLKGEEIGRNATAVHQQITKIMGPDSTHSVVNNLSWFGHMNFLLTLRSIGPHFSVNNMLRAECFKSRMVNGLSFLELSYMLLQAEDFRQLFLQEGCTLQIGGDDQWSNILAGVDLIHKMEASQVFGLTLPLLINSDGTKMGKTERGAVWLDANKTSVFDFFQFWRNIPDDKVDQCISFFTSVNETTLTDINWKKKFLAVEVTELVHGKEAAHQALEQAEALFEKRDASGAEAIQITDGIHVLDVVIKCGFAKSRTEARNLITNRGITINEEVQTDPTILISKSKFGNEPILKKGKKHFCRLLIEDKCPDQNT
jgi:tyrosyl-tRNA synthetase